MGSKPVIVVEYFLSDFTIFALTALKLRLEFRSSIHTQGIQSDDLKKYGLLVPIVK